MPEEMPYTDIVKRRACHKRYYLRNLQRYYDKNSRRKKELINFVIAQKHKPCADCGVKYPHYIMDFDHKEGEEKVDSICIMASTRYFSKDKILQEISKCDLVCSNWHRRRTHNRLKHKGESTINIAGSA